MIRSRALIFVLAGVGIILLSALTPAAASSQGAVATPTVSPLSLSDDYCLGCHGQPGTSLTLEDGSPLELFVDPTEFAHSIHGELGYACVQCHRTVGAYPHPPFAAKDRREVSLQLYPACYYCHSGEYEATQDSVHATKMSAGDRQAAICTDCHTAHTVRQITEPQTHQILPEARLWIPQTCAQCHNAIYQKYQASVHGSALTEGNPDVPTCIDCHGVHRIENPTTAAYRLKSPEICAKCHTDPKRMAKYGISTNVLSSYVADFHGTTVTIFEKQSPDAETNKPVCFDCHGVHDIARADDPQKGLQVRQNLLKRCQTCHPDATADFPDAWLSHYEPSPDKYPLVYYVNLFYKFFIPTVLGGMGLLVAMDFGRSMLNRRKQSAAVLEASEEAAEPAMTPGKDAAFPETSSPPEAEEASPPSAEEEVTPSEPPSPSVSDDASPSADEEATAPSEPPSPSPSPDDSPSEEAPHA